jgi:virginiamycin B lyase
MKLLCKICCSILMVVLLTFGSFIESAFADEIIDFAVEYPNKSSIEPPSLRGSTHEIAFKEKEPWDGKLWITGQNYDQLVAIDTNKLLSNDQKEAFTFYQMPEKSGPHGIGFDEHGYLWVTLEFAGKVIRISPHYLDMAHQRRSHKPVIKEYELAFKSGDIKVYDVQLDCTTCTEKINTHPHGLAINNHDHTVWYTGKATGTLGRINKYGEVESFPISKVNDPKAIVGSVPIYIKADSQGNMWFTELVGNAIGRIAPNGTVQEFKIRTLNSRPIMIVEGPNGNMWFTEEAGNKVGRITPDGSITEFPVPKPKDNDNVILAGLAFDNDGNLWVQQYVDENHPSPPGSDYLVKIDKEILDSSSSDIDKTGFHRYKVPTCGTVMHRIDRVPDGNLWFTELKTDKVGLLSLLESDGKEAGSL